MEKVNQSRRKLLKGLLLGGFTYSLGCFPRASNLSITEWPTFPIVEMSKEEGEYELLEIAVKATEEDIWVMVPYKRTYRWYDLGFLQSLGRCSTNSLAFDNFLKSECSSQKEVKHATFYHIHPLIALLDIVKRMQGDFTQNLKLIQTQLEVLSVPSPLDMIQHVKIEEYLRDYPNCTNVSKVVTPFGIFTSSIDVSLNEHELTKIWLYAREVGFNNNNLEAQLFVLKCNGINVEFERKRHLDLTSYF